MIQVVVEIEANGFVLTGNGDVAGACPVAILMAVFAAFSDAVSAAAWCAVATYGILKVIDATLGLRVSEDSEREGLDLTQHGESGYGD